MPKQKLNILLTILFAGILLAFYFFDPAEVTFFPSCYFKKFTGFDCPGCGGQRALHDLLHLRFGEAADHNLLAVLGSPILSFVAFNAFFSEKKRFFSAKAIWLICGIVLLFWVLRNSPLTEMALFRIN